MYRFIEKYKFDIISLLIITVSFFILLCLLSEYLINILIDFGREVYFPELMLNGKLLYKDLFNLFGPLAYQINTFLYQILGIKVSALKLAGAFCSLVILYFTYFISRLFLNIKISFSLTILILVTCVFSPSVFNFIYPYSYSLLYSYTAFLGSVLFFLQAMIKNKPEPYLILSYFLMGISIAAKYEFVLFIFILVIYSIYIYKQKFIDILTNFAALLFIPALSYGYLLYQGVTVNNFIQNFNYIKNHISSHSLHYFYTHSVGTFFSLELFNKIILNDLILTIVFIGLFFIIYANIITYGKYFPSYLKKEYILLITGILLSFWLLYPRQLYLFIPYYTYCIFILYLVICLKSKRFNLQKDLFFALLIISFISIIKTAFILDIRVYGTFSFILPVISITYFITTFKNKLPELNLENSIAIFILILVTATLRLNYDTFSVKTSIVETPKAIFHMHPIAAKSVRNLLTFIDENISKEQGLLVLPEGAFINYITERDMKLDNYYSLLPTFMETYGENKIINDLQNAQIEYIIITPRKLDEYGINQTLCETADYNKNYAVRNTNTYAFCNYLYKNYNIVTEIGDIYTFRIYKRK